MSKNNPVTAINISCHNGGIYLSICRENTNYRSYRKYDWSDTKEYGEKFLKRCFFLLNAFNANGMNGDFKFNALKDD